ncbi:Nuclease-related domain-containing protein [Mariprofundus aestuarium]|uniref:Nuclease-related domain-containing protein n=1 Tax=Mariprofundus aestuarium TaxID=1921086 RepID=A0A2K8KYB4_MARES|nr:nuclease-related domain-containing protein [Mariprofundus aestuarium]ATX79975.1 Nuclease-related domain-containing protein [Mariprofundus aestuarium]
MTTLLPILAAILLPALLIAALLFAYYKLKKNKVRSPFTQNCLREPGYSLRLQLEQIDESFMGFIILITGVPMYFFAAHITLSYFSGLEETVFRTGFSTTLGALMIIFAIVKLMRLAAQRHNVRLALDGEISAGQLLDPLKRKGFYIYHDVQAKGFYIDHILIGPSGVFTVKTKACSKLDRGAETADSEVVFDGNQLIFPDHTDAKAIDEATQQAQWFKQWLIDALGEEVHVHPLLVVPGWHIDHQVKSDEIGITNGADLEFIESARANTPLSKSQIEQITHQLEQKCTTPCFKL